MKRLRKIINISLLFILVLVLGVGGYCGYILLSYKRIGDTSLDIESKANKEVLKINETYNMATYNIGFGAYSQDFTFFLDTGYDKEGNETCGYYSKARSKEEVYFNVNGAKETIKSLDLDFALLQEVDIKSTRSYKINQNDIFKEELDKREADIKLLEEQNAQIASELAEREKNQEEREKTFNLNVKKYDDKNVNVEQIANNLNGMRPEAAVDILTAMDDQTVIDVLRKVEELAKASGSASMVSYWLSLMEPSRAAEIQRKMISKPENLD